MSIKNDRWSALSMSERADLMNMYITNGISDLKEMKKHYNSFGDGGDTQNYEEKYLPGNWLQRLAYKFGNDPKVSSAGIATKEDIIRILKASEDINWNELDNNKATYLFGNILGLYPAEETNGKDYSWYLKKEYPLKYILGKIKEYEGVINPFNEYVIDSRDKGLIEELAKKGKGLYSNSDIEYEYMWDTYDKPPYKEDVANYHMQFVNTPNGLAVSASDLYDFGDDYNPNDYDDNQHDYNKLLTDLQVKAFSAVGTPYIYRQDNIPIKFVDTINNYSEEATRAKQLSKAIHWANLSEKDLSEGVTFDEKLANILETGYIEPSVITAKKSYGGRILDGNETEQTLSGVSIDTSVPLESRKDYLNKQRQAAIDASLEKSYSRTDPDVPKRLKYANETSWREILEAKINYNKNLIRAYTPEDLIYESNVLEKQRLLDENALLIKELSEGYKEEYIDGASCIYTATGNYGDTHKCSWNVWFRENPEKYGFTEINLKDVKPGDIIQDFTNLDGIPHHALTFIGYDDSGKARYNYSSGGNDSKAIKKQAYYPYELDRGQFTHFTKDNAEDLQSAIAAYRFVGNEEDNNIWNNDYNQYRKNYSSKVLEELKNVPSLPKDFVKTNKEEKLLTKRK